MALIAGVNLGPNAGFTDLIAQLAAANGGGDSFFMTGKEIVIFNNGSGGTITITLSTVVAAVPDNFGVTNAVHDITLAVPAGKIGIWGPAALNRFKDVNGNAQLTYSGVTTLTVGVFRVATTA